MAVLKNLEERNEVCEDVLAPKQNPVISEEHVEENPSPCEEDATCATLKKILDSVSVQEEVVDGNVTPGDILLEDADKVTGARSAVAVEEQTDSNPVISVSPLEDSVSLLERQPQTEMLTVIIETVEDEDTEEVVRGVSDV